MKFSEALLVVAENKYIYFPPRDSARKEAGAERTLVEAVFFARERERANERGGERERERAKEGASEREKET